MSPSVNELPEKLKPYRSLGMELKVTGKEAIADCPFCGREKKFSIRADTGQWRCFVCNQGGEVSEKGNRGGNVYTFIRHLWEEGREDAETRIDNLQRARGILYKSSLLEWGISVNKITGEWIVPGYDEDREIMTLYHYTHDNLTKKMRLFATAELGQQLCLPETFDESLDTIYVCEGVWDAIALYEALRFTKKEVEGYALTGAIPSSLGAKANVVAIPSCNVFKDEWFPLFAGKKVIFLFDNDHPRLHPKTKQPVPPAAFEGLRAIVARLASTAEHRPTSIHWLEWGPDGYDQEFPSGYDVRDVITSEEAPRDRVKRLWWILEKIKPIPAEWVGGRSKESEATGQLQLQLLPCHNYKTLYGAFNKCLVFHEGLDRALSIMLAIIVSTKAGGDQLWGTFIGPPACGKSTLCEAISTAIRWVTAKSTIRGFHSGYKSDAAGKEDNSLIPLIADKTLVTKDGDTLMTSPNLAQILAEARDLYDRTSRSHYRHGMSRDYQGLNMTWILCGTGGLADIDTSELGQRFIKIKIMDKIDRDQEWMILLHKAKQADRAMDHESDGKPETNQDPDTTHAYQLCGGYVEYLRSNAGELLKGIELSNEVYVQCAKLATFVAYLRARPSKKQKENAEREFGTRLTSQFVRLTKCLCVVLNVKTATPDVMRRVWQTAMDTAQGRVMRLIELMIPTGTKGCDVRALSHTLGEEEQEIKSLLVFLKKIEAVELFRRKVAPHVEDAPRWRVTPQMAALYHEVVNMNQEQERVTAAQDERDSEEE